MKTLLRAVVVVLGIGNSAAYADGGEGEGYPATTLFTSTPGEQSIPSATSRHAAIMIPNGAVARGYVTISRQSTSLFRPVPVQREH